MARNDDRARDRRAKRRGEEPGEPEDAASPDSSGGDVGESGDVGDAARAEIEARAGVSGAPVDLAEPVDPDQPGSALDPAPGGAAVGGEVARGGGPRFVRFLRASWAELQRVRWPTREQVGQGTAVTLGFVVVAGAFLGFADVVARQIVNLIL